MKDEFRFRLNFDTQIEEIDKRSNLLLQTVWIFINIGLSKSRENNAFSMKH